MDAAVVRLAVASGVGGGLLAAIANLAPALAGYGADGRIAASAGVLAGLVAMYAGLRGISGASPRPAVPALLRATALIALLEGAILGAGLYVLYRELRPGLLADRYALYEASLFAAGLPPTRLAGALAELAARAPQSLDPAFQAVEGAGTLVFCSTLFGAFVAFRAHVARRLPPRPGPS